MPDLAACYFCGAALDEPRSAYRLGSDADAPTVTLCDGCKEKLDRVLEALEGPEERVSGPSSTGDGEPADRSGAEGPGARDIAEAASASADADATTGAGSTDDEPAGTADADPADSADDSGTATTPGGGADAADDPADDGAAGDERTLVEGDQEISALEYNRVMRLLQNREFPVDREEIVTVAANAYQVARADCDRVIDVAIDRGLIDERDGELVRTD